MKNKSLLIQLIISIFLIMVLFLGIIGISYFKITSNAYRQLTKEKTQQSIQQGGQFVSSYLNKLRETTKSLSHNQYVVDYLNYPTIENQEKAMFVLHTILEADSDLVAASIVLNDQKIVSTDSTIDTTVNVLEQDWYKKAISQEQMLPVLVPAHLQKVENVESWVISIAQEISSSDHRQIGVLRLDIDYSTLANYLDHLELGENGFPFIMNDQHEFVYHPEKIVYVSEEEMNRMKPYIEISDGYTNNGQQYVFQTKIPDTMWTLIGVSSLQGLQKIEHQTFFTFLIFGLISLVVCVIAVLFLIRYWIKPIQDLQQAIFQIRNGKNHLRVKEHGAVEIKSLTNQFNKMLDANDHLMNEIKENEQSIRQYELQALSSQINPHFLYNTLDTIVWMAEFNHSQKVVDVTKSLARYFRLALNHGNEEISLHDELDHVRQYLFIQKQRYADKLNYDIDETVDCQLFIVPKLIIQPIVENAIYHGIKEVSRNGLIQITVSEDSSFMIVEIYDNGAGFEQNADLPDKPYHKTGSIGLKNVDQRLRLYFGFEYHMKIESKKGEFTKITLYLPKNRSLK